MVPVLGYLYFENDKGKVPSADSDIMKGSLSLGMIVGQIGLGLLGDAWGRRAIYGKELMVTLFGTLMVVLLPWKGLSPSAITAWVSVFRVVAGVGIGAGQSSSVFRKETCSPLTICPDYPLSSVLSAEKKALGSRGIQVLTVFSFIGLGNYVSSIIFLVLLRAFKSAVFNNIKALEWVWRLQLGLGMVPAAITLYSRLTMPETKPYKQCKLTLEYLFRIYVLINIHQMCPAMRAPPVIVPSVGSSKISRNTLVNGKTLKFYLQPPPRGFSCKPDPILHKIFLNSS